MIKKIYPLALFALPLLFLPACSNFTDGASRKRNALVIPSVTAPNIHSWASITKTFSKDAATLTFEQAWLPKKDKGFREGTVRLLHGKNRLYVLADLTDDLLVTRAKRNNENLWSLGDVFEIFARDLAGDTYYELHTASNGKNLQLNFPSQKFFESRNFELDDLKIARPMYQYRVRKTSQGWQVYAELDAQTLFGKDAAPLAGREWLVSFGRYDYYGKKEDSPKVLSSTSRHKAPLSYHHQRYWTRIVFAPDA
ncbi:MAG: hypothetical protein ACK5LK_10090 [Chthoniobacterales bacterium]